MDAGRRRAGLGVEHVGGDRRRGAASPSAGLRRVSATYPPRMGKLNIDVGDLHFTARWEQAAPQTIEAIRRMLPIESKLIHCRWSGESTWIPYGDFRPGIDYENHTSHPAPGMLAMYPGGISECEIFFPYGACTTSSKVGQLAANHFATIVAGRAAGRIGSARSGGAALGGRPGRSGSRRSTADATAASTAAS